MRFYVESQLVSTSLHASVGFIVGDINCSINIEP